MKNKFQHLLKNTPDFETLMARFPIVILTLVFFTGGWIFNDLFPDNETLVRSLSGLIIGAYLCVMQTIIAEGKHQKPNLLLQLIFVLITGALAFFSESLRINMFMAIGAVLLALGNVVQWRNPQSNLKVWDFTHQIWTGAVFAFAGSIIFGLGLLAIMAALKNLFDVNIETLVAFILFPIGYGLLAPLYWLGFVPKPNEDHLELLVEPTFVSKAVAFMGTWLLAPLTLIYALILITYGLKIGISMTLPKGEIAGLTVPFLIIGTLTWLLLEPPFIRENPLARLFRAIWFPVSLPASILLAVSVAVRVSEYGLTSQRLALIGCVIWALGIGIWFTIKGKNEADIRLIPGGAACLLTFGAILSGWLSLYSQSALFERNLHRANILQSDGKISFDTEINEDAAKRAKGAAYYLLRHEGSKNIAKILNIPISKVENTDAFMASIRLKNISVIPFYKNQPTRMYNRGSNSVDVRDYDTISKELIYWSVSKNRQTLYSERDLKVVITDGVMTISYKSDELKVFDFEKWLSELTGPDLGFPDTIEPFILYETDGRKIILLLNSAMREILNYEDDPKRVDTVSVDSGSVDEDVGHYDVRFYILTNGFN